MQEQKMRQETMLDIHGEQKTTSSPPLTMEEETTSTSMSTTASRRVRFGRLWSAVQRYPIPFGSMALMLASLVLWLAGRVTIAGWMLLAVTLLGGIPLLWETVHQFLRKEFGVHILALLAIA